MIQTNVQPSTNLTMLSIHQNGDSELFVQFDQILSESGMILMLENHEIRIDWATNYVGMN